MVSDRVIHWKCPHEHFLIIYRLYSYLIDGKHVLKKPIHLGFK